MRAEYPMLGLFERVDNRVKLHVGVGWNDTPAPMLSSFDNRGVGTAGPYGVCYFVGNWRVYTRPLAEPFLSVYGMGRHRA